MKEIENIIEHNRELFDTEEPSENHFENFDNLLQNKRSKQTKKYSVSLFIKAASVLILLTLSSLWVYDNIIADKEKQTINLPTLSEAEISYTSIISDRISKIESIDFEENKLEKEILLAELQQMDTVRQNLQKELEANPNDEKVTNAIIQYYQTKLHVINNILSKLNNVEIQKQKTYEKFDL